MCVASLLILVQLLGFPYGVYRFDIAKAVYDQFSSAHSVQSIQVLLGGVCKVMFESPESKNSLLAHPTCVINGFECQVLNHAQRSIQVQVNHFPAEDDVAPMLAIMRSYGEVVDYRFQVWPGIPSVNTGTWPF